MVVVWATAAPWLSIASAAFDSEKAIKWEQSSTPIHIWAALRENSSAPVLVQGIGAVREQEIGIECTLHRTSAGDSRRPDVWCPHGRQVTRTGQTKA